MSTSNSNSNGTALITGASSGIGAVYADRLARRGYDLILVARNQQRLATLAATLTSTTGRKVDTIAADLTLPADVLRVEERLRSDPSITALVNNAGFGASAKLIDSKVDELENMIQLNVTALTRLTLAALPGFVTRAKGSIINISSIVALAPELLNGTYSGTKAYVVNFTQSLNHELVDAGLAAFDQHELITIPSLPDAADWEKANTARLALGPNLSRKHAAERYKVAYR
jgi:short-subunit dehydrogenase